MLLLSTKTMKSSQEEMEEFKNTYLIHYLFDRSNIFIEPRKNLSIDIVEKCIN